MSPFLALFEQLTKSALELSLRLQGAPWWLFREHPAMHCFYRFISALGGKLALHFVILFVEHLRVVLRSEIAAVIEYLPALGNSVGGGARLIQRREGAIDAIGFASG